MARDVVTRSVQVSRSFRYVYSNGFTQESGFAPTTGTYISSDRARGDLRFSDGHAPTIYSGRQYAQTIHPHLERVSSFPSRRINPSTNAYEYYVTEYYGTYSSTSKFGSEYLNTTDKVFLDLDKIARSKVLLKLVDSDVNIGNFLGEAPESLKMIASNAITVLQAARAVKRGQLSKLPKILGVKKPSNLPGSAAGVWFAYKFGWEPLVSDIYNMHSAVMKQLNRPLFEKRVGRASDTVALAPIPNNIVTGECERSVTYSVSYRIANKTLAGLNSLGLINPAAIAWELFPLSFVFDWMIPVGNFLNQLSATLGLEFAHGYVTRRASMFGERKGILPPSYLASSVPIKVQAAGSTFGRDVLSSWPIPALPMSAALNPNQLLTLSGLLAQRAR